MGSEAGEEDATLLQDYAEDENDSGGYIEVEGAAHSDDADTMTADTLPSGSTEEEDSEHSCDVYCNSMLAKIGVGRYQLFVLLLCGLANASDAVELMSISFLLSSTAQCDLMLTDARKGVLTAAVFIGMIPGGLTFGLLADKLGRRLWLGVGLVLNAVGTLFSSQAMTFSAFVGWRILSGFGVGGSIPILFSFILEFVPVIFRGKMLVTVAFFWVVGTVICASIAWGILGVDECPTQAVWAGMATGNVTRGESDEFLTPYCAAIEAMGCSKYNGRPAWRSFMAVCCVPASVTTLMLLFANESPKWLVQTGQRDRARDVLRRMATVNGLSIEIEMPPRAYKKQAVANAGLMIYLAPILRTLKPPARVQFLWLAGVWFFLCFGFYGFRLWMTDFFSESNVSDDTNIYAASFYVALANIPGYFAAGKTIDYYGRKKTLILSMVTTGFSLFAILIVKSGHGILIFSCLFAALSAGAWCALDVLSVERFPTAIRSTALAMLTVVGRVSAIIGTLVFGFLSGKDFVLPILLTAIAFIGGGWCCKMLPKVRGATE